LLLLLQANHETKYKVSQQISTFNYLSDTPCGVCPVRSRSWMSRVQTVRLTCSRLLQVFEQCAEGNIISPRSCLYMTKWLDLKELEF
jgi:DNA-directed RNA polymerase III subunit RPC6